MAKSISAEELQLRKRARRRLIGAIALVTIVAVFLPMALDHDPKPLTQDISIQIPALGSGALTSRIVPVPEVRPTAKPETPAQPVAEPEIPAKDDAPKAAPAPKKPATEPKAQLKPAAQPAVKHAPEKTAEPARPAAGSEVAYVVQVAALNDANRAKQMQEKIAAAGVKSYTEVVPAKNGNVTRVRAGPFASRDEAEKVLAKLKGMGLNGNVVTK